MKSEAFRTLFIVNPRAAGGRTERAWKGLSVLAAEHVGEHEARMTQRPGHATEIAREGLKSGFEMIVAVGGDGTNNEVINGFFENGRPIRSDAVFATIPQGTGCDFARGMKISKNPAEAFRVLAGRHTRPLDVGRIDYSDRGNPATRYFVNIAGFGANGDVVARVNRSSKKLGGFATFLGATVASILTYRNPKVAIRFDGGDEEIGTFNVVFVCNAKFCGGGMKAGPLAEVDDGLFDLTLVGDMSRTEALLSGRLLYSGKIYGHPKVRHVRVRKLEARPLDGEVLIEADGEQPGILPATWSIVPSAARFKVPAPDQ